MTKNIQELRAHVEMAEVYFAKKLAYTLGPVELKKMMEKDNVRLIDVRAAEDYAEGHIPQAISIPKAELKDKLELLLKEDINIVYCYNQQCHLAASAAYTLALNGYPPMELEGGFSTWVDDFKFEIEK